MSNPDLPHDWGKINGEDHPDSAIARGAMLAERERCARIIESAAGFPTHKLRREAAAAIRNPNTFWEPKHERTE